MNLTISAVKLFQENEMAWYYRYCVNRIPKGQPAIHFTVGTWWHSVMRHISLPRAELYSRALDLQTDVVGQLHDSDAPQPYITKFLDESTRLCLLLKSIPTRFAYTNTKFIETPLSAPLPNSTHVLFGTPDAVVELHGKLFHVQYKTISDRTSIPVFIAIRPYDLHELSYAYLICHHESATLAAYGGTLMNITRKLSSRAILERPHEAFVQELIPISESDVYSALSDLTHIGNEMAAIQNGLRPPILNRAALCNRYNNVLSEYFDAFTGRISIHDDNFFQDAPPRYDDAIYPA